jgi:hypothetical protein
MEPLSDYGTRKLSRRSTVFLERTARSITEIQPSLDSVPEIVVFLEVLGYNNKTAVDNGFKNLFEVASHLYGSLDHYMDRDQARLTQERSMALDIPSVGHRLAQGLSLTFPWMGSLAVLYFFGVSLWLVWGLPIAIVTSLIVGVFLGLLLSEGPMQLFQRLVVFYYNQYNLSEVKRALRRSYYLSAGLVAGIVGGVYLVSIFAHIPFQYAILTMISGSTIFVHRVSYILVYALRKFAQIVVSYAAALVSLLAVYFLAYNIIPLSLTRYLVSLGSAIVVLSVVPIYYGYRVFTARSVYSLGDTKRNPLNTIAVNSKTIMSNFRVQLWEGLPYYLFGMLFFATLFGDRVLSWAYNPVHNPNGISLPLVFNSVYHVGADVALLVIFPAAVIQFVIMTPISEQLSNLTTNISVTKAGQVDGFLKYRYVVLLFSSVFVAVPVAFTLVLFAPVIESWIGGTGVSVFILRIAATANVLVAVFMANSLFLIFLNKIRRLVGIALVGVLILGVGGMFFAQLGFENIVMAYLFCAAATMALSTILVVQSLRKPASLFFSRYM